MEELGMTWPQVFDGKGWEGEISRMFGVHELPSAVLVDGTTGKLLAPPSDMKAESLGKVIDRVLTLRDTLRSP